MLRFATFLAPNMAPVYEGVTAGLGRALGVPTELAVGRSLDEFDDGRADVGFICGLPYVLLARRLDPSVELLGAPVLRGERYGGRPIYFSDVIVHKDSPFERFADLKGASWAYNEPLSHSGYNLVRHHLIAIGETSGFFSKVVAAGWHEVAVRMVATGAVDASAIDSQVLAVETAARPELASELRVIEVLGPSTIQPVVVARRLPESLKADIRAALASLTHADVPTLDHGFVERFEAMTDEAYDDIRAMLKAAERSGFMTIR